jgi:hypothetical protein
MSGLLVDGTDSAALVGGVDDFSTRVVTNDYYRSNCVNADLWNDVAHGIVALERRLTSSTTSTEELSFPVGIAINTTDSIVYVADAWASICAAYGASGNMLTTFGGPGSAAGRLKYPTSVAVDGSGNVHISDSLNHRIQSYDKYGTYLLTYCGNQTATGTISYAWSIAYGSYGGQPAIWAYDWFNYRLIAFNPTSGAVMTSKLPSTTAPGSRGLAFSSVGSGKLIIADPSGNRALVYDLATSTTTITATGITSPLGVHVDASGAVWMTSSTTPHICKYTLSGNSLVYSGTYVDLEGSARLIYGVSSMTSYGETSLYAADSDGHEVQVIGTVSGDTKTEITDVDVDPYWLVKPFDVAVDANDCIYIIDSHTCQLTKVTGSGSSTLRFGEKGYGIGEFQNPVSVSVSVSGDIYVADMARHLVTYHTATGAYSGCITGATLSTPTALRISSDGSWIVVVEESGTRVTKYTNSGGTWSGAAIGSHGAGTGQYTWVKDVTIGSDDSIYLLDGYNGRVLVYDSGGSYTTMYWTGSALTGFTGIAIDVSGLIYITDAVTHKLRTYNPSTDEWELYTVTGALRLWGIDIDSSGYVYICDPDNSRVVVLDSSLDYHTQFKFTNNNVFDPVEAGGSKLVSPLRGFNSNLLDPDEADPISEMYERTYSWNTVMLTSSALVTSAGASASIPFYMSFDVDEDTFIFPVDWRTSVRTTNTGVTGMPIVTLVRPATGDGEAEYITAVSSDTDRITFMCALSNRDGTVLPALPGEYPCVVNAFVQAMRR